jgi:glutaminase
VSDNPFISGLTAEEYDLLARLFEPFQAPAHTPIVRQGEGAAYLYLIESGRVSVRYKPYDGPIITVTHLHAGDIFGWSAVVGHDRYTSDVVSTTELRALRLRGRELRRLCSDEPEVGGRILEKLAGAVSPRWVHAKKQIQVLLQASLDAF